MLLLTTENRQQTKTMTQQEIQEKVNTFMTDRLEYDTEVIHPDAELRRDLGMTSLDVLESARFIQLTFGFQPEISAVKSVITLQDLYEYIEQHQQ